MSDFEQLQIKLLSNSGELLRCVNCFAGQITVMRGHTSTDLQPYQRALAGIPGPERLALTLDGDTYNTSSATLVGFGESFSGSAETVAEFLGRSGVSEPAVDSTLVSFGLDGLGNKNCSELSPDQERRVRLVAATSRVDKILVLNNPFEDISSQWKERFAKHIEQFARTQKCIAVVPSLNYRPECWIDNDSIARVQVGENLQRTIGFGGSPDQMKDMVSQMREIMKDEEQVQEILSKHGAGAVLGERSTGLQSAKFERPKTTETSAQTTPTNPQQTSTPKPPSANISQSAFGSGVLAASEEENLEKTEVFSADRMSGFAKRPSMPTFPVRPVVYSLVGLVVLYAGSLAFSGGDAKAPTPESTVATAQPDKKPEKTQIAAVRNVAPPKQIVKKQPTTIKKDPSTDRESLLARLTGAAKSDSKDSDTPFFTNKGKDTKKSYAYALDMYPNDLRMAILGAFDGKGASSSKRASKPKPRPQSKSSNLFNLLESTSGTGDKLPDSKRNIGKSPKRPSFNTSSSVNPNEDPEERRERIRQKFLEAIERAAAKRREQGG